jgi:hypothetical protein
MEGVHPLILLTWLVFAAALGIGALPGLLSAAERVVLVEHYTNFN